MTLSDITKGRFQKNGLSEECLEGFEEWNFADVCGGEFTGGSRENRASGRLFDCLSCSSRNPPLLSVWDGVNLKPNVTHQHGIC